MNDKATHAITNGVHHVGLTVPNLEKTRTFFLDALGFKQLGELPEYPAAYLSDGSVMITLWQASDPDSAAAFDRKNVIGLHHLALTVSTESLDELYERLKGTVDVSIEFSPEPLGRLPVRHMMCTIPGGIRLEFVAPND